MQQNKEKFKRLIADVMAQGDVSSKLANPTILINFWIIAITLEQCINPSRIILRFSMRHYFHYIPGTSTKIVFCRSRNLLFVYHMQKGERRDELPIYSKILSKMC